MNETARLLDAYESLARLLKQMFPAHERHLDDLPDGIVNSRSRGG